MYLHPETPLVFLVLKADLGVVQIVQGTDYANCRALRGPEAAAPAPADVTQQGSPEFTRTYFNFQHTEKFGAKHQQLRVIHIRSTKHS